MKEGLSMENREIRPMDDRPYSEKDFENMFKRLEELAEENEKN